MRNLKRVLSLALALVMMLGMMVIGANAASTDFDDSAEIKYTEAVDVLTGLGVLEGYDTGDFQPNTVLTREQAAKIICYMVLGADGAETVSFNHVKVFEDVAADRWSAGYIAYCANMGYIAGNGDGTFDPAGKLTGVAFAKLLLVALGYDAEVEGYVYNKDWATNIGVDAIDAGIILDGVLLANPLTREQAAQMTLQALESDMVAYESKGAEIITADGTTIRTGVKGPYSVERVETGPRATAANYNALNNAGLGTLQLCEKYYPELTKTAGTPDKWGRPAVKGWEYDDEEIYNLLATPVATYTTAVPECDIAEKLNLKKSADVVKLTFNTNKYVADGVDTNTIEAFFNGNEEINTLATKATVGEQGRLTEIYKAGKDADGNETYQVVMIDTFLAKVTGVTEVEYDRNGHIAVQATLTLKVYDTDTANDTTGTTVTLKANKNYTYQRGNMLLINAATYGASNTTKVSNNQIKDDGITDQYVEIVGYAESMVGAQTAFTNQPIHIIDKAEYNDAIRFDLDQAMTEETDHTWYFDTYGNLIGAVDIDTIYSYGTISEIKWVDSNSSLEKGYALAKITYMDGTSDTLKVASIDTKTLYGVEGKAADYTEGAVSSTLQYNEVGMNAGADSDYTNVALYKIESGKNGLQLTTMAKLTGAEITNGVPEILNGTAYANSATLFLVWNEASKTYETYTGIKEVPSYVKGVGSVWAANLEKADDTTAEYVFLINPEATTARKFATFFLEDGDRLTVTSFLDKDNVKYYSVSGGYVNGAPEALTIQATGAGLNQADSYKYDPVVSKLLALENTQNSTVNEYKNKLALLEFKGDNVIGVTYVTNVDTVNAGTKSYAAYLGIANAATLTNGTLVYNNNESYDISGAKWIGASGLDQAKRDNLYLYVDYNIVTTNNNTTNRYKVATTIYATKDAGLETFTVTFVDEDGTTVLDKVPVNDGETVAAGDVPAAEKAADAQYTYTLVWLDKDGNTVDPTAVAITGNVTFTAHYNTTVNEYTVTIITGTGVAADQATQDVAYGSAFTVTFTAETGYTLASVTGADSFSIATGVATIASVTDDVTIEAAATANVYTLTLKSIISGTTTTIDTVQIAYNQAYADVLTKVAAPDVSGYSFQGWNTKADGTGTDLADATFTGTKNATIYAYYEADLTVTNNSGVTVTVNDTDVAKAKTTTVTYGEEMVVTCLGTRLSITGAEETLSIDEATGKILYTYTLTPTADVTITKHP